MCCVLSPRTAGRRESAPVVASRGLCELRRVMLSQSMPLRRGASLGEPWRAVATRCNLLRPVAASCD
eukprot:570881-Lingulodinium_polyedra.AAC.1